MQIGIPLETAPGETRVAATPETAKKLRALEVGSRTTRAQCVNVPSSQAHIANHKVLLIGANRYQRLFPVLMGAAGGGATLRFRQET